MGDPVRVNVDVTNRGKRAWPQTFVVAAGGSSLRITSIRSAGVGVPETTVGRASIYRLGPLPPQATARVTLDYLATRPGGDDAGLTAVWGAPVASRPPSGASSTACPFAVHARHPSATAAQRRAGTLSLHGRADPHAGFITGRNLGTVVLPRDSTLRWTAVGNAGDVRSGSTIEFEFSSDELSAGSQAGAGVTSTSGSHFLAAGSYHSVRIRAIGRWSATIAPR